jgi:hypothetical protein
VPVRIQPKGAELIEPAGVHGATTLRNSLEKYQFSYRTSTLGQHHHAGRQRPAIRGEELAKLVGKLLFGVGAPELEGQMKRCGFLSEVLVMVLLATAVIPSFAQCDHPARDPTKLGKVNFPISCDPALQAQFNSAVAMLHSSWYEKTAAEFAPVAESDPTCGISYWGLR